MTSLSSSPPPSAADGRPGRTVSCYLTVPDPRTVKLLRRRVKSGMVGSFTLRGLPTVPVQVLSVRKVRNQPVYEVRMVEMGGGA